MQQLMKIALIPAYEPESSILELVGELRKREFFVLVVDDGSSEDKAPLFQSLAKEATVLSHRKNRGKGRALKTGISYIQTYILCDYVVVTVDADGQHRPEDVQKVCIEAEQHPGSLILGSRKIKKNTPLRSRLGNQITRLVYQISTGTRIYDTQTGLRAFDQSVSRKLLHVPGDRYEYEMNVLLSCSKAKLPMREVEIETVYIDGNAGSHFHVWKDSCRIYKEILKFSASSFVSFLLDYGMYSILLQLTAGISQGASLLVSNAGARLLSAGVNYRMNQKLVFQSTGNPVKSAMEYAMLAMGILAGNTVVLELLVKLGMNQYWGKLCTELLFFCISWFVQRQFIFRRKEGTANG